MTVYKISNISLKDVRKYLKLKGAKKIRTRGGHEIWSHRSLPRSIPIQTHIDPVYEFVVQEIIDYFGDSKKDFHDVINPKPEKKPDSGSDKPTKRGKKANKKKPGTK